MKDLKEHQEPTIGLSEILKTAGYVAGAGTAATVGGVVVVGTSACSGDNFDYEAWAETDGAAGRINMQAVQESFDQAADPTDFENRVNEIYEGEHPILIRVQNTGNDQVAEGWEDLNDDGQITDAEDDKLFSLTRPLNGQGQTTLRGHGANGYYTHHYPMGYSPMGGFFMGYMMSSMMYSTSMARRGAIVSHVRTYRGSSAYGARRNANRAFHSAQRTNPAYNSSRNSMSKNRQSFRGNVRSSGGSFRSSGGTGRSSGFRGGGR